MALEWVSVSMAAQSLGVSPRAIQKRAARGTLAARKVERGGAAVWEIDGRELGASMGAPMRTDGRECANLSPQVDANAVPIDADTGREPVRQMDANAGAVDANRAAEYRAEIAFLRATVEQLQQSEAQTKAALREALKAMPKQLTTGAAESAPERAISPSIEASAGSDAARSNGTANAPDGVENLSYGDIATWLENQIGR